MYIIEMYKIFELNIKKVDIIIVVILIEFVSFLVIMYRTTDVWRKKLRFRPIIPISLKKKKI